MNFLNSLCNSEKGKGVDYQIFFKISALLAFFIIACIGACNVLEKKVCNHNDDFMKQDLNEESCVNETS